MTLQAVSDGLVNTNREEAIDIINTALEYDKENTNLIITKAVLLNRDDKEGAIRLIDLAKKKHPDHDGIDFIYKKIHDLE